MWDSDGRSVETHHPWTHSTAALHTTTSVVGVVDYGYASDTHTCWHWMASVS